MQVHLNVLYFLLADQQIILCLGWLRLAIVALGARAPAKGGSLRGAIGKCGVYPIFFTVICFFKGENNDNAG